MAGMTGMSDRRHNYVMPTHEYMLAHENIKYIIIPGIPAISVIHNYVVVPQNDD